MYSKINVKLHYIQLKRYQDFKHYKVLSMGHVHKLEEDFLLILIGGQVCQPDNWSNSPRTQASWVKLTGLIKGLPGCCLIPRPCERRRCHRLSCGQKIVLLEVNISGTLLMSVSLSCPVLCHIITQCLYLPISLSIQLGSLWKFKPKLLCYKLMIPTCLFSIWCDYPMS